MNEIIKIHLLLIEDDEDDYIILRDTLLDVEGIAFDLNWIKNVEAARVALKEDKFDVYLIDYRLGKGNGIELIKEAREKGNKKPMIILTGLDSRNTDLEAMRAGANDFLIKGRFNAESLGRSIRYAQSQRLAEDEREQLASERAAREAAEEHAELLRQSEEHYRLIVESVKDYAIFTLKRDGQIASWNEGSERILGFEEDEVLGKNFSILYDDEDVKAGIPKQELSDAFLEGNTETQRWHSRKDGERIYCSGNTTPLRSETGNLRGFIKVLQNITERRKQEEKITHQAFHDELTGLPNRVLLRERLNLSLQIAERNQSKIAVLFMDMDRFKIVNDTLGHKAGDEMLIEVGRRISEILRDEDTIARFGGDEFIIILNDIKNRGSVISVIEKIFASLATPVDINGQSVYLNTSIGISMYPEDAADLESLIKHADLALHQAKEIGRTTYCFYEDLESGEGRRNLELEKELREALGQKQFKVYYHPIVNSINNKIIAAEALVRWQHPTRGLIAPGEFLPHAEEIGIMHDISQEVLQIVCENISKHKKDIHFPPISVNVAASQFYRPDFLSRIQNVLLTTKVDPSELIFEVTEHLTMRYIDTAIERLNEMKRWGAKIALDDFGIGHSSLNYLKLLPIDFLKLDRSFVQESPNSKVDSAIIRSIIDLADEINITLICEGIENAEQLEHMFSLKFNDWIQGFYFFKPMEEKEFVKVLKNDYKDKRKNNHS